MVAIMLWDGGEIIDNRLELFSRERFPRRPILTFQLIIKGRVTYNNIDTHV